jgi:hypothetical protein
VENQVVQWERGMDDSCFCAYVLLYWSGNGSGLSFFSTFTGASILICAIDAKAMGEGVK